MERLKQNKVMAIISTVLAVIVIAFLFYIIPVIKHNIAVNNIKHQIEEVQLQIELNKEQWNTCLENMDTWHAENEQNRQILNDLMLQYNDMVGFTTAWQE